MTKGPSRRHKENRMDLLESLERYFGKPVDIKERKAVSGGDINRAYELTLSDGNKVFMKANRKENADFFRAEAEGLEAIRQTGAIDVPRVISYGKGDQESFLLMEYISEGKKSRNSSEELGRRLAEMHQADAGAFVPDGRFGFLHDNYIGAGFQKNAPEDLWIDFFIKKRLKPQFDRAGSYWNPEDRKKIDRFLERVDGYLTEPVKPSLLHGDLWAGNYMIDCQGIPWLIDPAAYVGHPEADLAMTELFGGFDSAFYGAYREAAGIDPEYKERRDLYNLYHLLNHLNLFGGSYLYSVRSIVARYV